MIYWFNWILYFYLHWATLFFTEGGTTWIWSRKQFRRSVFGNWTGYWRASASSAGDAVQKVCNHGNKCCLLMSMNVEHYQCCNNYFQGNCMTTYFLFSGSAFYRAWCAVAPQTPLVAVLTNCRRSKWRLKVWGRRYNIQNSKKGYGCDWHICQVWFTCKLHISCITENDLLPIYGQKFIIIHHPYITGILWHT